MRKGFGFHDRHSPLRFDPATLFIGGAIEGAFYNPSNITTLFQDNAGTTPVTAVEQTVGRILDLSGNANHATQSVLASRPTYRARYNLLTYSEDLSNAVWIDSGATVGPAIADPNGNVTAVSYGRNTSQADARYQVVSARDGTHRVLCWVKAGTSPSSLVWWFDATASAERLFINIAWSGGVPTLTAVIGSAAAPVSVGNGWYFLSLTTTSGVVAANTNRFYFYPARSGSSNGNTAYLWGADVRPLCDAGYPYQRVVAATVYNTVGFPPYLAFDGSNDSMLTGSIDFTGTDKMTVWAGATKLSDAAQGVVAELSATIASNNGAFLLSAPNSAAANYNWSSKGTTQVDNTVTTYTAPHTAVLTSQADIAAPSNIIRVNGAQAGSVTTTQGTGNFGNYALNIGRRNNASLPFNGRLYGLIVLGAAATDWQVFAAEQWMAQKTGISII